jgi:hypothetical protein
MTTDVPSTYRSNILPAKAESYFHGFFTEVSNKDNRIRPVYVFELVRNKKAPGPKNHYSLSQVL